MKLLLKLDSPIQGYWDGGPKSSFEFSEDGTVQTDKKGKFIKIGSWEANYWFHVAKGRTERLTLGNAKRHLTRWLKEVHRTGMFEYI